MAMSLFINIYQKDKYQASMVISIQEWGYNVPEIPLTDCNFHAESENGKWFVVYSGIMTNVRSGKTKSPITIHGDSKTTPLTYVT